MDDLSYMLCRHENQAKALGCLAKDSATYGMWYYTTRASPTAERTRKATAWEIGHVESADRLKIDSEGTKRWASIYERTEYDSQVISQP